MATKQAIDQWLQSATEAITDDSQKASVLTTHIKEREATLRATGTDKNFIENRAIVRCVLIAGLTLVGLGACIATCQVADDHKAVEIERIHGEHPGAFAAPSAAPAATNPPKQ